MWIPKYSITSIPKKETEENYETRHTSECITRQMTAQERFKYFGEEIKDGKVAINNKLNRRR